MQSQEFSNESYKIYYNIAKGFDPVTISNFGTIYDLLPDIDSMSSSKEVFSKSLLEFLKYIDSTINYSIRDFIIFEETPAKFNKRVMPGTSIDNAIKDSIGLMQQVNQLYGNYSVAIHTINFFMNRTNTIINLNKELLEKYSEVLTKLNKYEKVEELKRWEAGPLVENKPCKLELMPEEVEPTHSINKKLLENEEGGFVTTKNPSENEDFEEDEEEVD